MTQHEQIIDLFRRNGYRVTLRQMLQTTLAAEYRARLTELRKRGYTIICEKGKQPSDNLYTMIAPDDNGQMRLII